MFLYLQVPILRYALSRLKQLSQPMYRAEKNSTHVIEAAAPVTADTYYGFIADDTVAHVITGHLFRKNFSIALVLPF